jgi:membrane-associated phospholipid phosphatase
VWLAVVIALAAPPPAPSPWLDGALTVGGLAGWASLDAVHPHWVETSCPCGPGQVNALERPMMNFHIDGAELGADAVATALILGAVAVPLLSHDTSARWRDALLVVEAMALTGLLTQVAKTTVGRPYPYMHGPAPYPEQNADGVNYASFWSGHTAVPMAGVVAAARLYAARNERGSLRWWLWTVGPTLALLAGGLQVAASNHYPSDVLMGGAVGVGVGLLVPTFRASL